MSEDKMLEMSDMDGIDYISDGDFGDDVAPQSCPKGLRRRQ